MKSAKLKGCTTAPERNRLMHLCAYTLMTFAFVFGLSGCEGIFGDAGRLFVPEGPPFYEQIADSYLRTELKTSGSADVLATINIPEYELLSQSKSVVASLGQKKAGYKTWLKMVAFDEDELTVQRKYLLIVDERPKFLFVEPWESLMFDCEMVLEKEVLDEPYADDNARRIAILRRVLENVRKDTDEVSLDNKPIGVCGMLINQTLETVLVKLDSSPALAAGLSEPAGFGFEHTSFDKGKIKMLVVEDIVTIEIKLGSLVKKLKVNLETVLRKK